MSKKFFCKKCKKEIPKYVWESGKGKCFDCERTVGTYFRAAEGCLNIDFVLAAICGAIGFYFFGNWGILIGAIIGSSLITIFYGIASFFSD